MGTRNESPMPAWPSRPSEWDHRHDRPKLGAITLPGAIWRAFCLAGLFLAATGWGPAPAQSPAGKAGPPAQHRAKVQVRYDSRQVLGRGVTLARLSNGLAVIVGENHAAPVATVRCFVQNTGSAFEGKYLGAGISHLVEHLVAGGSTTTRSEEEIRKIVDRLGGQTNAFTSNDVTAYYIDCPAGQVDVAVELIADSMQRAAFVEPEFRREMEVVQRELEMGESERASMGYQTMKSLVFTLHPMRHPIIGYLPVLQKLTRQDVIDFYRERYVPQNMVFVVGGDVQTGPVLDKVLASFAEFQRTAEPPVVLPVEPEQASPRSSRIAMEGETVIVTLAWPTVPLQHPDLYALDVADYLLTHGDSSRLARRLRIDRPLAISVSSASYTPGFVKGWFEVEAECQPQNVEECRHIVLEEIERLSREEVRPAELAKAKRQKAAEHVFGQQSIQDQANMLAESYRGTGDPLFDSRYVEGIQQVTAADVRRVAQEYFRPERLNLAKIEPLGTSDAVAKETGRSTESPMVKRQLANGLTVLLKRNAVLPLVTVQAFVRGGSTADTVEKNGLATLAADMMLKGTRSYSGNQIAEFFDSIGGSIEMSSQRNTTYLQCLVLKEDLEAALGYAREVLVEPTFPQDEFAKVQRIQLGRIAARKAQPQSEILDFWTAQLPPASPYSRTPLGTEDSVARIAVADCQAFHRRYFVPNNMVLAVVGDIDPQAIWQRLESVFGSQPKDPGFSWPSFPQSPAVTAEVQKHLRTQKENTAMVLLSYPSASVFEQDVQSRIEMLEAILTGGASGRLHEELRGAGLVYYVFGFQITGWAPGYFLFLAQTRPETTGEVISRIEKNLERIRTEGIPAAEFEAAREKLLAAHAMRNTTATTQAFQAGLNELFGLGYDFDSQEQYARRLAKVTPQDVVELVGRHFRHALIATSSPVSKVSAKGNSQDPPKSHP